MRRRALLERWREELGQRGGLAVATWADAVVAGAEGRVEALLVDGRTTTAWECPSCGWGALEPGACPLDSTSLEVVPGGALELAVGKTLVHDGVVRRLAEELEGAEVAALLRYAQPTQV